MLGIRLNLIQLSIEEALDKLAFLFGQLRFRNEAPNFLRTSGGGGIVDWVSRSRGEILTFALVKGP